MLQAKYDYFTGESLRKDLKKKTVRGGLYTALAQGLIAAIALVMVPLMARLLQPADFGMVAMVTVFTGFAAMFVDAGFSMATIQQTSISHQQVSNLFWITAALGFAIACVTCLLSPAIAWFYGEPRLIPITCALAASFILSGLTAQHLALLRRAMRFNAVTLIQVVSYALSYVVALGVAWYYRTYWALIALPLSAACFRLIGAWLLSGWTPSLPRREPGMRNLIGFGAHLTGFTLVNYFARSGDNMLIGWQWGDVSLGFYERAYKLMMAPLAQINAPLMNVIVPALSRLREEPAKYREAYFRATGLLQIVACPLMAFVAVTAPLIVEVAFGPRWAETGPILRWLAIAGLFQPICNTVGWLYISQGRTREFMHWGFLGCGLIFASFLIGLPWGPTGVACSYALMICAVVVPLCFWFVGCRGPVTWQDLFRLAAQAIFYALPMVIGPIFVAYQMPDASAITRLIIAALISGTVLAAALLATSESRKIIHETILMFKSVILKASISNKIDSSQNLK